MLKVLKEIMGAGERITWLHGVYYMEKCAWFCSEEVRKSQNAEVSDNVK